MANSAELPRPWDMDFNTPGEAPLTQPDLNEQIDNLAEFLGESPIHFISIDSVISTVRFGAMYRVHLIKEAGDGDGFEDMVTDNMVIEGLTDKLLQMSPKEVEKYQGYDQVFRTLELIEKTVNDKFNWDIFLNGRKDH